MYWRSVRAQKLPPVLERARLGLHGLDLVEVAHALEAVEAQVVVVGYCTQG